ncbi:MAG: RNHCP domain-containing protein [Candidatus Woesebacteria bacterium]|nr:MAG: RNHCP domain-containing protein [Candidatus Woesebacteria bacterium]
MRQEASFRCSNCRVILSADPLGSKHRNHCPLCLWSKHVDLSTPGDRKSDCCARMQPVAIAFKDYRINPFTNKGSGELMVIHQCLNCGKISPNRIAGDDNEYQIMSILNESMNLSKNTIIQIKNMGLEPITSSNEEEALISLFGINYKNCMKNIVDWK